MRRWLRWQFVVPRLLLVMVAILAGQYVLGLAARSIAVRLGEAAFGARLESSHARVSLMGRKVVLNNVNVTNPHGPSQTIVEADECELNFATGPLLHKQAVIDSGRMSGLRLGLLNRDQTAAPPNAWYKDDADLVAQKWLERLGERFTFDLVKQFESVERTEAFCAKWSEQSAALDARLEKLDARAAELQQAVDAAQTNPLRNDKALEDLPKNVAALQKGFAELRADVEKLPDLLDTERRAIVAARRHDGDVAGKRLQLESVEANALSAYLLRDETGRQLNQLIGWVRWVREMAPGEAKPQAGGARGEDILFAGCRRGPGILIRSLQLEGAARIGGQPVELCGVLTNLVSEPRLHDQPARLRLAGGGSLPFDLQATVDRTGPAPRDELLVDCQGVLLPKVGLGRTNQLELQLAPSVGSLSVSVLVEGDKLTGDIQMVQQKVQMTPAFTGPGSAALSAAMGQTLGRVNSIATRLSLSGTLEQPTCTLWSNLGAAVAEAMQRALNRAGDQHTRALLVEAGRRVDERLAEVDRQIAEQQSHFARRTGDLSSRLQKIAASETPRYRISAEQGGRRLPSNSLFR